MKLNAVFLVATALCVATTLAAPVNITRRDTVPRTGWMKFIPDGTHLTEMTIPGTHDSATGSLQDAAFSFAYAGTQNVPIAAQLQNGIRFLDVRVGANEAAEGLFCYHGIVQIDQGTFGGDPYTFHDVLSDTIAFLDANPTEGVIMSVKIDHLPDKGPDDAWVSNAMDDYMATFSADRFLIDTWSNGAPTMGALRNKIHMLFRFDYTGAKQLGPRIDWDDNAGDYKGTIRNLPTGLFVSDNYDLGEFTDMQSDVKENETTNHFQEAVANQGADKLFLTFLSASHIGYPPIKWAAVMNPFTTTLIANDATTGRYGIVLADFQDKYDQLVARLIARNNIGTVDGVDTPVPDQCDVIECGIGF